MKSGKRNRIFCLKGAALFLMLFQCAGCSKEYWSAKLHLIRAENAYEKAGMLRHERAPYDDRLKYYQIACDEFSRAYRINKKVFTLYRIESAEDACWRIKDVEARELFQEFSAEYGKEHPTEVEYGDAAPTIGEY